MLTGLTSNVVVNNDDDDSVALNCNLSATNGSQWTLPSQCIIKLGSHFRSYNYIINVFRIDSGSAGKSFHSTRFFRAFEGNSEWKLLIYI